MVQEGTPNLHVTLKGYPNKFSGLLDKVANKTQQMIQFHPKRGGLSLTLMLQGQTYNPNCNPKQFLNETLGFGWDGCAHSADNTMKVSDWLIYKIRQFALVKTVSLITQPISAFSQQDFNHRHFLYIHIDQASQISYVNL